MVPLKHNNADANAGQRVPVNLKTSVSLGLLCASDRNLLASAQAPLPVAVHLYDGSWWVCCANIEDDDPALLAAGISSRLVRLLAAAERDGFTWVNFL